MAIDAITLSLSGKSFPSTKENTDDLVATAVTSLAGSPTNATDVRFELLYSPIAGLGGPGNNGAGLMEVLSVIKDASASPTGTYSVTFPAALFAAPGAYRVRAKGETTGGSNTIQDPLRVTSQAVTESVDLFVADATQADETNILTDEEKIAVQLLAQGTAPHDSALEGRVSDLEDTVGDQTQGLVKNVADLQARLHIAAAANIDINDSGGGTVVTNSSHGFGTITRLVEGKIRFDLSEALDNAEYIVLGNADGARVDPIAFGKTVSQFEVWIKDETNTLTDANNISITVIGAPAPSPSP